jgi:hypothetical protein
MSDVIRDVVVRITLEQIQAAIKAPDITAAKSAGDAMEKIAQTIADANVESAKISQDAILELKEEMKGYLKTVSEANEKTAKADIDLKKKQAEEANKLSDAIEVSSAKQVSAQLKVLDTTKQVGAGAFQLARGFAFLATSTDENFQKMLQTIAKLQGGFDIISGGASVIKGMVQGMAALKVATGAATVTNALYSASHLVVAGTAAIATAAVTALKVALGPIGLIITGIGLAAAALAGAWNLLASSQEAVKKSIPEITEEQKKLNSVLEIQLKLASDLRSIERDAADKKLSLMDDSEKTGTLEDRIAEGKIRAEQLEGEIDLIKRYVGERRKAFEDSKQGFFGNGGFARGALDAISFGATASNENFDTSSREVDLLDRARQAAQVAREQLNDQEKLVEVKKRAKDVASEQLEKERQLVAEAQKGVETAKQRLQVEESKLQSINAQFGALSKEEQVELRRLAEKVKAGEELNRIELQRASQLGGDLTRDFVQRQQAAAGQAAGAADIGAAFGNNINAGRDQAQAGIEDAIRKQAEAEVRAEVAQTELTKATEAFEATTRLLSGLIDQAAELGKRVKELESANEINQANNE